MLLLVEKLLFYIFLFSIPFQTRLVLRSWGLGFNEWNSVFLYFTDILLILVLGFWILRTYNLKPKTYNKYLILFLLFSGVSIFFALNKDLAIFRFLKLIEFLLLYFYIKSSVTKLTIVKSVTVIIFSGIFQSIIAFFQFVKQSSLGLKFLGESPLGLTIPGVATFFDSAGTKFLRAYGTFPHPNLLAVFLFVCIFLLIYLLLEKQIKNKTFILPFLVLNLGLILTFSRVPIYIYFISLIFFAFRFYKFKFLNLFLVLFLLLLILIFIFDDLLSSRFAFNLSDQAINLRLFYIREFFNNLDFKNFISGVGIGNFVPRLMQVRPGLESFVYQPIHNIYLLILAESGIFALIAFLIFLFSIFKQYIYQYYSSGTKLTIVNFVIFFSFLIFGLLDHFFLTLQQGGLIFWFVLGFLTSNK